MIIDKQSFISSYFESLTLNHKSHALKMIIDLKKEQKMNLLYS